MKKMIYAVAAIATVAIAGWNYQQNKEEEMELSDLAMANVEALASGETTEDFCDDCIYVSGAICKETAFDGCMGYHHW